MGKFYTDIERFEVVKHFLTSGFGQMDYSKRYGYAGARYTTVLFSITQTAKINNLQVSKYLEYVLDNLNQKSVEALLTYSKSIPKTLQND